MTRMFVFSLLAVILLCPAPASGQSSGPSEASEIRDEMLRQFSGSSRKMVALSEAMPEDLYAWSTGEGMMTVAKVYAHIARYNFMYLEDQLGVPAPSDIDLDMVEDLTDKAVITELLKRSVDHVLAHVPKLTDDTLTEKTRLYGRDIAGWAVLVQLVTHLNEHVGQAVAYARINQIAPPWAS